MQAGTYRTAPLPDFCRSELMAFVRVVFFGLIGLATLLLAERGATAAEPFGPHVQYLSATISPGHSHWNDRLVHGVKDMTGQCPDVEDDSPETLATPAASNLTPSAFVKAWLPDMIHALSGSFLIRIDRPPRAAFPA